VKITNYIALTVGFIIKLSTQVIAVSTRLRHLATATISPTL